MLIQHHDVGSTLIQCSVNAVFLQGLHISASVELFVGLQELELTINLAL